MHAKQQGFSVLEGLLAILIFSVGVLGIVGLQASSTKAVSDAKYRIDASYLANQVIGRMWIDDHTTSTLQANYNSTGGTKYLTWKAEVLAALPGAGVPTITVDANNVATVTVFWTPPGAASAHKFVVTTQIK